MTDQAEGGRRESRTVPDVLVAAFNALPEDAPVTFHLTRGEMGHLVNSYTGLLRAVQADHDLMMAWVAADRERLPAALEAHRDGMFKAYDEFYAALTKMLQRETKGA
jgi:hypothetical protein